MTNNNLSSLISEDNSQTLKEELLELLLNGEESYPWDVTTPEAEEYFNALEAEFSVFDGLDETEITAQADSFFTHLNQTWESVDNNKLTNPLLEKFSQMVPRTWLETIIKQAEKLANDNLSQLNQLVECVKPLWKDWTEEDLRVFARPLAYAMRGENQVKQENWENLSEIDQIRFTMFIAKEILSDTNSQQSP
ncbi:MAG: hypothetical protein WBM62_17220 [Crocosphaera sp.]